MSDGDIRCKTLLSTLIVILVVFNLPQLYTGLVSTHRVASGVRDTGSFRRARWRYKYLNPYV